VKEKEEHQLKEVLMPPKRKNQRIKALPLKNITRRTRLRNTHKSTKPNPRCHNKNY